MNFHAKMRENTVDIEDKNVSCVTFWNVRNEQDKETFEIGVGIHTGSAIVGNVGSDNRMDYTVIGDTVNGAGRLQQMAKGGEIIIGELTYSQTQGLFSIQKRGEVRVKNKTEPVMCYDVLR